MNSNKTAILYLIIANIIWGAGFPIYKWALEIINPFTFAFLKFFLAAIIILPFTYKNLRIPKKQIPLLILISIVSITLHMVFLFFGLKLSPSINAPIILSSGPIVLIIASAFILKETVKPKILIGTLISLMGVLFIMFRPLSSGANQTDLILGNTLLLLSMLCGVAQAVVLKKILYDNEPLPVLFWSFIIGSIPLIFPVMMFDPHLNNVLNFNLPVVTGIIYAAIPSSVIGYYFLYYGIKYIKASEIGIFSYVDPIATVIIAVPLLMEKITNIYLLGAFLVFFGIFITEERIHYHPFHKLFKKDD